MDPLPARETIRAIGRLLKRGGPGKADLWWVPRDDGAVVIKDFCDKPWWGRLAGRIQIARERAAYAWLASLPALPRFAGTLDGHALALEWIDGEELWRVALRGGPGAAWFAELERTVARMHAAGVAHLDLRGRENVLLDREGRVRVVDLASAVRLAPESLAHRLLFPLLATVDRSALLKWKRVLGAGAYTDEEQSFLRRHRFWRSLWMLNPKRRRGRRRDG